MMMNACVLWEHPHPNSPCNSSKQCRPLSYTSFETTPFTSSFIKHFFVYNTQQLVANVTSPPSSSSTSASRCWFNSLCIIKARYAPEITERCTCKSDGVHVLTNSHRYTNAHFVYLCNPNIRVLSVLECLWSFTVCRRCLTRCLLCTVMIS